VSDVQGYSPPTKSDFGDGTQNVPVERRNGINVVCCMNASGVCVLQHFIAALLAILEASEVIPLGICFHSLELLLLLITKKKLAFAENVSTVLQVDPDPPNEFFTHTHAHTHTHTHTHTHIYIYIYIYIYRAFFWRKSCWNS
jgi:hypothetical protein